MKIFSKMNLFVDKLLLLFYLLFSITDILFHVTEAAYVHAHICFARS